jgi:hypothetical protein
MRGLGLVFALLGILTAGCGAKAEAAQPPPPPARPAADIDHIVETAEAQYAQGNYEAARKQLFDLHDELEKAHSPKAAPVLAALEKAACAVQLPEAAQYFKAWPAKRKILEKESQDGSTYQALMIDLVVVRLYLKCVDQTPADVVAKLIPKPQHTPIFLKSVTQDVARFEAKAEKIQAYFTSCGTKPQRWFDGGVRAAETFMKQNANDPDSIDVENCTEPVLMTHGCWRYTCDVRGKNAFGALILNRITFRESDATIRQE